MRFYDILKNHADQTPNKPAVIDGEIILSYQQLLKSVEAFAGALTSLSLTPQSKVGILCVNQTENLITLLGGFFSGVPVVPLNPLLNAEDLAFIVKDASLDILIVKWYVYQT